MKKIFTFLLMITVCQIMFGQNGVGIGTTTPHAPLQFDSLPAERKIVLSELDNNDHEFFGFGVSETGALKYQIPGEYEDHVFQAAISDSASLELMRITGYGFVGIGTLPQNRLDIHFGGPPRYGDHAYGRPLYVTGDIDEWNGIEFRHSSGTQGIGFGYSTIYATGSNETQLLQFSSRGNAPLNFKTNYIERMTITGTGNVGIGVAPLNKLDIATGPTRTGTHPTAMAAYITANLTGAGNGFEIRHYDGSEGMGLGSNTLYAAGSNTDQNLNIAAKGATGNVVLKTNTQERMVVNGSGNVGINVPSMANRLDINGGPTTRSGAHSTGLAMYVTGNFGAASNGVEFRTNNATQGIGFGYNTIYASGTNIDQDLNLAAKGAAGNISLSTNGSEKLKITGTGNFGFSVTAPSNKLDVHNGTARTGIHGTGQALYVTGGAEFRSANSLTGLGITSNAITATGLNPDVDLSLASKGPGFLSFSTDGTERMKIAGNGSIGIRVTNPLNALDVSDGTPRTGSHPANLPLYVTGYSGFSTANGEQGLGIIGSQISAAGSLPSIPLIFFAKGPSGDMQFIAGNSIRMRITAAGNVGIGTVSPNAPLQFSNTPENRKIVLKESFGNDHQYFGFGYNANILRYQTDNSSSDHVFYSAIDGTSSKELLRIKGNGNVGIGMGLTNPLNRFDINNGVAVRTGTHGTGLAMYVTGDFGAASNGVEFRNNDATQGIGFASNTIYAAGSNASQDLNLAAKGSAGNIIYNTNGTEKMRISSSGNVGIGIAGPANKLDIAGAARTNTHNTGLALYVTGGGEFRSADATIGLAIGSNNIVATGSNASVDLSIAAKGASGNLIYNTNGSEKMRISSSGNVGIGTSTPHAQLQLATTVANRKLVLYEVADNDNQFHGFGIDGSGAMRYQTANTLNDHVFYAAASAAESNELMRIHGDGNVAITGIIETEAVIVPALINNFTPFGFGYAAVSYYKDKEGIVHVRSMANVPANPVGLVIFNLPAGYRPSTSGTHVFMTLGNNVTCRADVASNGDVIFNAGTTGWVSLDGIAFRAD